MENRPKILLVDDEEIHSLMLFKGLEKQGYDVTHVLSGEEAIQSCFEDKPDLILLDVIMPGVSGLGVLKGIREKYQEIELPIIMVTTESQSDQVVQALNMGANDYLVKPVDFTVAEARISTQLKIQELSDQVAKQKELEALNAMIVTYNHEIINPLSVALFAIEHPSEEKIEMTKNALLRISDIVKKIELVTASGDVDTAEYTKGVNMIKLK